MPRMSQTTPPSIAEQLRTAIRDSGRSIRSIALEADVSEGQVRRFMQNHGITLETAEALAKALGKPFKMAR